MTDDSQPSKISTDRRKFIKTTAAAGVGVALAGCSSSGSSGNGSGDSSSDDGSDGSTSGDDSSGSDSSEESSSAPVEIIHWWTAGGEADALNSLIEGFQEEYPEVEINNNPSPGGLGANAAADIRNRLLNQEPPGTFQNYPGAALMPYIEANLLGDIGDSVWDDDMSEAYYEQLQDSARPDGTYVTVPLNIHRLNNLFYNVEILESAGVDPASLTSPQDLISAMETIENETDAVGMAHTTSGASPTLDLWASAFRAEAGGDAYTDFIGGNVGSHESAIKAALETVSEMQQYMNEDMSSVSWDQAANMLPTGDAAFFHHGDWAGGLYLSQDDLTFGEDWDYIPFPGTRGMYTVHGDSFTYPANNPSPSATQKFLSYCGSVDAQERFNSIKGSVPPRSDVPDDKFNPFIISQKEDLLNADSRTPSMRGLALPPSITNAITQTFAGFIENWNIDSAYSGIQSAFDQ